MSNMTASARQRQTGPVAGRHGSLREGRRETFIDAAIAVVRRDGRGASMEAVAREAGVTKPILYRVFEDRDGLVRAVGDRFATELGRVLEAALSADTGVGWDDPRGVLSATIDAYVAIIDNDPEVYRFLTAGLARDPSLPVVSLASEVARNVAVVLGQRLRDIGVDDTPAELWAHGIVGMVHLAGDWWVDRRTFTRAEVVEQLVRLLWDGLGSLDTRAP
jgi:AcrR family transcriptional regulator